MHQENVVFYTIEFYSVMKKSEILSFSNKWMELEDIYLSKVSQSQKNKNRMFSLICGLWIKGKYSNVFVLGSEGKGRAQKGDMGIGRKHKT
jgi:hypothetical protein